MINNKREGILFIVNTYIHARARAHAHKPTPLSLSHKEINMDGDVRFTFSRTNEVNPTILPTFSYSPYKGITSKGAFKDSRTRLNILQIVALIILVGIFITYAILALIPENKAISETLNIYIHSPVYNPTKGPYTPQSTLLTNYPIWIPAIVYLVTALVFQILILLVGWWQADVDDRNRLSVTGKDEAYEGTSNEDYHVTVLLYGSDWLMWLNHTVTGTIILWMIAQIAGISDVIFLVALAILHMALCIAGAFAHEQINNHMTAFNKFKSCFLRTYATIEPRTNSTKANQNNDNSEIDSYVMNWWPYLFATLLPAILIWGIILTHFIVMAVSGQLSWFYWTVVLVMMVLYLALEVAIIPIFYGILKKKCEYYVDKITEMRKLGGEPKPEYNEIAYLSEIEMINHNRDYDTAKIVLQTSITVLFTIFLMIFINHK